jgi:hypothetical protein
MGLDAFFEPVEDRAQVEVVGFDVPEVAFDVFEVRVGGDDGGGSELAVWGAYRRGRCQHLSRLRPGTPSSSATGRILGVSPPNGWSPEKFQSLSRPAAHTGSWRGGASSHRREHCPDTHWRCMHAG